MANGFYQAEALPNDKASQQMYGPCDYPIQSQALPSWSGEASQQIYGPYGCPTRRLAWQTYGPYNYPIQMLACQTYRPYNDPIQSQTWSSWNDEASPQMYMHPTQMQTLRSEQASRQTLQVQWISELPTPQPQTTQLPKPKAQPRKFLTDEDRLRVCQRHENNPSKSHKEIAAEFGVERSTISKIILSKKFVLQALQNWALETQKQGEQLTGSAIEKKARDFACRFRNTFFLKKQRV